MAVRRRGFRQDGQGNVAMLTAICGMVLVLAMGSALDFGRAYAVRYALQAALDTASIASVRWIYDNEFERGNSRLQEIARSGLVIFSQRMVKANSNLPAGAAVISAPRVTYTPYNLFAGPLVVKVGLSLDVQVPTTFLGALGLPSLTFTVSSQATGGRASGAWLT